MWETFVSKIRTSYTVLIDAKELHMFALIASTYLKNNTHSPQRIQSTDVSTSIISRPRRRLPHHHWGVFRREVHLWRLFFPHGTMRASTYCGEGASVEKFCIRDFGRKHSNVSKLVNSKPQGYMYKHTTQIYSGLTLAFNWYNSRKFDPYQSLPCIQSYQCKCLDIDLFPFTC